MKPSRPVVKIVDAVAHVLILGLDWFWAQADADVCHFCNTASEDDESSLP